MGRGIGEMQYQILRALVQNDGTKEFGALQYPFAIEQWGSIPQTLFTLHLRGLVIITFPHTRPVNSISLRGSVISVTDAGRAEYEKVTLRLSRAAANGSRQLDWTTPNKGQ